MTTRRIAAKRDAEIARAHIVVDDDVFRSFRRRAAAINCFPRASVARFLDQEANLFDQLFFLIVYSVLYSRTKSLRRAILGAKRRCITIVDVCTRCDET